MEGKEEGCSDIYDPPFAASLDLRLLSFHLPDRLADLLYSALFSFKPAMASVCLNSIYHYQPAPSRGRPVKGRSTACNRGASAASSKYKDSIALAPNVPPSAGLGDYDLIECFDLTTSLPMEAIDPFGEPALGFGGTENAQGNVHCPRCRWPLNNGFQICSRLGLLLWPVTGEMTGSSHPVRSCCPILEKHTSHNTGYQMSEMEAGGLTAAAASTSAAIARYLRSWAGSRVPSALHRFQYQAEKLGTTLQTFAR